ncbi:MAG TPA: hypothetical protein PK886_00615 [Candidatus Paceibacterota bacterium]|nr:hypothetical protein [Candidatus Paceibacterota bacterium]
MIKKQAVNKSTTGKVLAVGASIAALSAAAYVLFGPDAKKNRKKISGWATKMKGEIIEKFEKMQEVTEPIYNKVIDDVAKKYAKSKAVTEEELASIVSEIKKHWKTNSKPKKKVAKKSK